MFVVQVNITSSGRIFIFDTDTVAVTGFCLHEEKDKVEEEGTAMRKEKKRSKR